MEFTVADAQGYTEDQIAILGMGEADQDGHSIMLQGSLGEVAESEREMGWDTYHISIDEDESFYGGIRQCVMTSDSILLSLSEGASEALGVDELRLDLDLQFGALANVAAYLRIILTSGRESEHPELRIAEFEE
jgi:hypothetical protein